MSAFATVIDAAMDSPLFWLLSPILLYILARVIFIAYFHAKQAYLRRLFPHAIDQKQDE